MAWLAGHKSKYIHLQSSFPAIGFYPFARDIQKKVTEVKDIFPPWKNTSIHWQKAVPRPHSWNSKGLLQGHWQCESGGLTQLYTGSWRLVIPLPPDGTLRSQSSCFKPPFHFALKDIFPSPTMPYFSTGFKQLTKFNFWRVQRNKALRTPSREKSMEGRFYAKSYSAI